MKKIYTVIKDSYYDQINFEDIVYDQGLVETHRRPDEGKGFILNLGSSGVASEKGVIDQHKSTVSFLKPSILILPTVFQKYQANLDQIDYILSDLDSSITTVGIVQGLTYEEITNSYNYLKSKVDIIGFERVNFNHTEVDSEQYKHTGEFFGKARSLVINHLISNGTLDGTKEHMVIGIGSPEDITYIKSQSTIKHVFTRLPSLAAVRDIQLDDTVEVYESTDLDIRMAVIEKIDYNEEQVAAEIQLIQDNISFIKTALNS